MAFIRDNEFLTRTHHYCYCTVKQSDDQIEKVPPSFLSARIKLSVIDCSVLR